MAHKSKIEKWFGRIRFWWILQDYVQRGDEGGWLLTPPVSDGQ